MTLFSSQLHDETTFYKAFIKDLEKCTEEVYIESPFLTSDRMGFLRSIFEKLIRRNIKVYILTRDPKEHEMGMELQPEIEISYFEELGVQVFIAKNDENKRFHRKLAIIDRKILWEGSLNILSQAHSREVMRRIVDPNTIKEMLRFLKFDTFIDVRTTY